MDRTAIGTAASLLAEHRLSGQPFAGFPEALAPPDEAAGYGIQSALHEALSARGQGARVGWKIGCTTSIMQRYLDIDHPCGGGIMASTLFEEEGRVAADHLRRPGVECEIAVRLGRDLTAAEAPFDRDAVRPAVDSFSAAIELVDDRYADWRALPAATLIADDFFARGAVVGAARRDWQELDLAGLGGEMWINGESVGQGRGRDILGHPLEALAWLANHLTVGAGSQAAGLAAGEVVLLGSLVQTVWLSPGDRVEVSLEGLGGASVTIG